MAYDENLLTSWVHRDPVLVKVLPSSIMLEDSRDDRLFLVTTGLAFMLRHPKGIYPCKQVFNKLTGEVCVSHDRYTALWEPPQERVAGKGPSLPTCMWSLGEEVGARSQTRWSSPCWSQSLSEEWICNSRKNRSIQELQCLQFLSPLLASL